MKLQHHIKEEPTVDLTSLIDVVFLLLIFFMVSTTFERQALLKVDLPEASVVEDRAETPDSLELVIDNEGRMFLNNQRLIDSEARTIRAAIEQAAG
ncbi:MAG: biopolymer transporter ExbD, partial [Xanthomonadales bacterium]|nr:biopolymer transporter ExbD [Xanthomonadales bacterium]